MQYPISVGLDVHKNSISAFAVDIETGEFEARKFSYDVEALANWLSGFKKPLRCVYESGFCGFHLKRELEKRAICCIVCAISKLAKPSGDKVKTDKRDAKFLARQLAAGNIVAVWVPDIEMEGMRDIARTYEMVTEDLKRTKQKLGAMCIRYGKRYNKTKSQKTKTYDSWLASQRMPSEGAQVAFEILLEQKERLEAKKQVLIKTIEDLCKTEYFKETADALCLLIGIKPVTAFRMIVEIGDFKRFTTARGFAAYLGLVPSEGSSGPHTARGKITKTGNSHIRKLLIEISWSYLRAKNAVKKVQGETAEHIVSHARKANRRLMKKRRQLVIGKKSPNVANVATARELSMWIWSVAVMV
jgi:transposase